MGERIEKGAVQSAVSSWRTLDVSLESMGCQDEVSMAMLWRGGRGETYYLSECRSEMMIIASFKEVRYDICTQLSSIFWRCRLEGLGFETSAQHAYINRARGGPITIRN